MIDNLYFKSVIILHSKHELPGLLADYLLNNRVAGQVEVLAGQVYLVK